jgi:hypothetical protein
MKLLLLIGCFLLSNYHTVGQIAVSIKITQTASYCGGAAPPPDLIEQFNTPAPLADKVIYLRKGKTNHTGRKTIQLKSDANGDISATLKPGFYAVVDETKKDRAYYNILRKRFSKPVENYGDLDTACLNTWLQTPQQVIEVAADKTIFYVNFHQPCHWNAIPCVQYTGPMPP